MIDFLSRNLHSLSRPERSRLLILTNRSDGTRSIFAEMLEIQNIGYSNLLIIAVDADDQSCVGWAMIWGWTRRVAKVGVYVHPQFRRLGIGRELMDRMSKVADALGLELKTKPFTDIGRSFYESTMG